MKQIPALRIAIADDHVMVRQALSKMLNAEESLEVLLEADNGKHLLQLLETAAIDVVLLDLQMPVMDGRQTLKKIRNDYPHIKVIIITGHTDTGFEREYVSAGALAFLSKSEEINTIVDTIHNVSKTAIEMPITNGILTKREIDILRGIIQKHSNSKIAASLHLSIRTVENHRYNISRKTNTKTTEELIIWAKMHHLL